MVKIENVLTVIHVWTTSLVLLQHLLIVTKHFIIFHMCLVWIILY